MAPMGVLLGNNWNIANRGTQITGDILNRCYLPRATVSLEKCKLWDYTFSALLNAKHELRSRLLNFPKSSIGPKRNATTNRLLALEHHANLHSNLLRDAIVGAGAYSLGADIGSQF